VRCALDLFDLLSHDCAACYLLTLFFQIFTATREERAFEVGLCHDARGVRDLRYQCICNLCSYISFIRYTTVSQPECVDGWLGMQLSDNLWFPCWNSKVMSDSAARIIPLISFQEHTAALQPATPVPSSHSCQGIPASPRNSATPATSLPLDGSAAQFAPSLAVSNSDAATLENVVASIKLRLDELHAEYHALAARSAATDGSRNRSADPPAAATDADARRMYSVVEALLAGNRAIQKSHQSNLRSMLGSFQSSLHAMQDMHQSNLQALQQSLISNQCSLQEALAASQLQITSAQTHHFAMVFVAGCLGVALLAVVVARGSW
jgi:hypothetical protein